jgi:hypothetical protein
MKIFWSWQSDTPGKTGRHFVRSALEEAIEELKQPPDVEEPTAQARREELHLDHDRKDTPGSPDLARLIFDKIEKSRVFIADVTSVGEVFGGGKKLINSNVGIEYGHAHKALGDESILMVQNVHYGSRDDLPFDLKHKAGPIQYTLAPGASAATITAEKAKLKGQFVTALRSYLTTATPQASFEEAKPVRSIATFCRPDEVLGRIGHGTEDEIEYYFADDRAFYLRVMPAAALPPMKLAKVMDVAGQNRPDNLSPSRWAGYLDRNRFGVIALEGSGTSTVPRSLTQLFPSGELWGISRHFFATYRGETVIPTVSLENIYRRVVNNYCDILSKGFGIAPPYVIECGAIGLSGTYAGFNNGMDGPIHNNELKIRLTLNDLSNETVEAAVRQFVDALLDMAGLSRA